MLFFILLLCAAVLSALPAKLSTVSVSDLGESEESYYDDYYDDEAIDDNGGRIYGISI